MSALLPLWLKFFGFGFVVSNVGALALGLFLFVRMA